MLTKKLISFSRKLKKLKIDATNKRAYSIAGSNIISHIMYMSSMQHMQNTDNP